MIVGSVLSAGLSFALVQAPNPRQTPPPPQAETPCAQALANAATDSATTEICAGDDAARAAMAVPKGSALRTRQFEAAAGHYRRAATVASTPKAKILALNVLAGAYDADHLNDPHEMESVLRQLIALTSEDLAPMFRLAKLQEDQALFDAAEATLLDARHKQPDAVEPYRMLTQFFARRVTALHKQTAETQPTGPASNPGEPDADGVYRVGGAIIPPARSDVPHFPPEAVAAGVAGAVVAEVVIDQDGNVTVARVVQSIPLLDEEALRTVRNWHYAPTMVNGQAVPVRMNVTVSFTLR